MILHNHQRKNLSTPDLIPFCQEANLLIILKAPAHLYVSKQKVMKAHQRIRKVQEVAAQHMTTRGEMLVELIYFIAAFESQPPRQEMRQAQIITVLGNVLLWMLHTRP